MKNKSGERASGILLLNLGTPDDATPKAVGRYLNEFLMDKYVIDISSIARWILVKCIIVPIRKFKSAHAYAQVFTDEGSPLLSNTVKLFEKVKVHLAKASPARPVQVEMAMRYANPTIEKAFASFQKQGVKDILVAPLYPQYAESTSRSSEERCQELAGNYGLTLKFLKPFFDDHRFVEAFAKVVEDDLATQGGLASFDMLLMSFHGLPERHVKKTDSTGSHCLANKSCCDKMVAANQTCYRAHCYATARALAEKLGLSNDRYQVSFQSRLGRTPWIQPYTDEVFSELVKAGKKKIAVVCPSFVADCLETLEEVKLRGRESFIELGGEELVAIPCLNAHPQWVAGLSEILIEQI
jgi:protoporphyrin/coproporphyrin ferrochelatase